MTRRDLALHLLKEAGPRGITTGELLNAGVGSRYGARLLELRKEGHRITSERLRTGSFRYTLIDAERAVGTSIAPLPPEGKDAVSLQTAGGSLSAEHGVPVEVRRSQGPGANDSGERLTFRPEPLFADEEVSACRSHWIEE